MSFGGGFLSSPSIKDKVCGGTIIFCTTLILIVANILIYRLIRGRIGIRGSSFLLATAGIIAISWLIFYVCNLIFF